MNDAVIDVDVFNARIAKLEMRQDHMRDVLQQLREKVEELYATKSKRSK